MTSVNSPETKAKKIKQINNLDNRYLIGSRRKVNSIFRSKLVQSIREGNANLTNIAEFEYKDMTKQIRVGGL